MSEWKDRDMAANSQSESKWKSKLSSIQESQGNGQRATEGGRALKRMTPS